MTIKERAQQYIEHINETYDNMSDEEFFELMNESGFNIEIDRPIYSLLCLYCNYLRHDTDGFPKVCPRCGKKLGYSGVPK